MENCTIPTRREPASTVNLTSKFEIDAACFVVGLLIVMCRAAIERSRSTKRGHAGTERLLPAHSDLTDASVSSDANAGDMQTIIAMVPCLLHNLRAELKKLLHQMRKTAKKKGTTFSNYFRYLVVCCCTFVILFLTSLVIGMILDKGVDSPKKKQSVDDDFLGNILMQGPMLGDVMMMKKTLVVVLVNGILFLAATIILDKWCEMPEVEPDVRRTMWVHGLPVKDQRLNPFVARPFQLTSDDLRRVSTDLAVAFNEELHKQGGVAFNDEGVWVVDEWDAYLPRGTQCKSMPQYCVGDEIGAKGIYMDNDQSPAIFVKKKAAATRIAQVWVTPVVDKWRSLTDKLQQTIHQQQAYDEWALRHYSNRLTDAGWQRLYTRLSEKCQQKKHRLEAELLRLRLNRVRMCGSAFVMFRNEKDCEMLLGKPPRWWDCGTWMCLWRTLKFGHVPFTSVTLEYEPAPYPGDIMWDNMHVPRWRSELLFWFFTLVLVIIMVVIVTPLNVPQVIRVLEGLMFGSKEPPDGSGNNSFANHFSSLLLLLINRTLLPFPIQWIAMAGRFRRRTEEEIRQMHLNFWLLIVNTWIAPLVGVVFLAQVPGGLSKFSIPCLAVQNLSPKRLFVGYLIDATFLTNLYGILCWALFDFLSWIATKVMAIDALDRQKPAQPPPYSFGYYYAWTLSLVTLSLCISARLPSSLLIVAICFFIKTIVDWVNLRQNVYETLTTQEGVFITIVVFYMRLILCVWWLSVGVGLGAFCKFQGCSEKVQHWLFPACAALIVLACIVLFSSLFRMWYAQSLRRFIPGRLQVAQASDESVLDKSSSNLLQTPEQSEQEGLHRSWDARPAFRSQEVEEVLEEVRRRPHTAATAFQCLRSGRELGHIRMPARSASCFV